MENWLVDMDWWEVLLADVRKPQHGIVLLLFKCCNES